LRTNGAEPLCLVQPAARHRVDAGWSSCVLRQVRADVASTSCRADRGHGEAYRGGGGLRVVRSVAWCRERAGALWGKAGGRADPDVEQVVAQLMVRGRRTASAGDGYLGARDARQPVLNRSACSAGAGGASAGEAASFMAYTWNSVLKCMNWRPVCANTLRRHSLEQFFHYAVGARIAVVARAIDQEAVAPSRANPRPGVDADSVQLGLRSRNGDACWISCQRRRVSQYSPS